MINKLFNNHISKLLKIFAVAIIVKLCYFVFAISLFESHLLPETISKRSIYTMELFKRNDSNWYEEIYKNGYPKMSEADWKQVDSLHEQSTWAFFPLYPLSVKAIATITHTTFCQAGNIQALAFSLLCFSCFYFLAFEFFENEKKAFYCTLLFIIFPFHYYFSMLYSEAIFTFLVLFAFICIKKEKYYLLLIPVLLLPLARVNGIILLIPFAIAILEKEDIIDKTKLQLSKISTKTFFKLSILLVMILSFVAYAYYQFQMTSSYTAFSMAQSGWWRELKMPYASFFARGDLQAQFNSVYTILTMIVAIISFRKLPLSYNVFIWISLLFPLISGSTQSMQRFIIVLFPFMFLFGDFIYTKIPKWKNVLLVVLFLLQLTTFYYWILGDPFSY
jgi:Gpi18-like mannosyltransferase